MMQTSSRSHLEATLSPRSVKQFLRMLFFSVLPLAILTSCGGTLLKKDDATLGDIDISGEQQEVKTQLDGKKTKQQILEAYRNYIKTAPETDLSRQQALSRLADLELELINEKQANENPELSDAIASADDAALANTIVLLETTLQDYPEAKGNDRVLYQLAQAYDRSGRSQDTTTIMERLVNEFPKSTHYAEAQFRIGETYFARGDYIAAEDAYTEVLFAIENTLFYEKALFKRGWTRYKQEFYNEAVDDYYDAIIDHRFAPYEELSDSEKSQFQEYFRAIGLAFTYLYSDGFIRDYFVNKESNKYLYETYSVVSDLYLQQERYSDAAKVLQQFTQYHAGSPKRPFADIKVIEAWKAGNFTAQLYESIENFYQRYNPKANYWSIEKSNTQQEKTDAQLRQYIVQISSFYHSEYEKKRQVSQLNTAQLWYERYLEHFSAYAKQDNIYSLYGELLVSANKDQQALQYFAQAAFDGDLILDKKSAFSSISITNDLILKSKNIEQRTRLSEQYINFALSYVQLYSAEQNAEGVAMRAGELALQAKNYEKVVEITNYIPDSASLKTRSYANDLKGRAYLEQKNYPDAEAVYLELLDSSGLNSKDRDEYQNRLALSIYKQGEAAKTNQQTPEALNHFTRISQVARQSDLAASGLYDAIAITMETKQWPTAISLIQQFQAYYPRHKFTNDVTQKLSVAYLNSDQKGRAAQEFEKLAQFGDDIEVKRAALWKAAELYEEKKSYDDAVNAYREYANQYREPYETNVESMYRLTSLYAQLGDRQKRYFWQNKIVQGEQRATKRNKTDRTTFIASETTLGIAKDEHDNFKRIRLSVPLAKSLKTKKSTMQKAVKLFGQASSYGLQDITTEATFAIGEIYRQFSIDLLESERPRNLNADELDQYEILLEDQAFPFEEKAIEFYETNLARTQDGTYNDWINKSLSELQALFPVRYSREGKTDAFIN